MGVQGVEADTKKSLQTIRENEAKIALHPDGSGKERFYRTGRQVIAHCELAISVEVWFTEFGSMVEYAAQWASARASSIRTCYCSPSGSRVVLFVVPISTSFDFKLSEELADLNSDLLKKFNIGNLEIHQVPGAEADRFIDFKSSQLIYGSPQITPTAVDAQS